MLYHFKTIPFIFVTLLISYAAHAAMAVRVLLSQADNGERVQWVLNSEKGFIISEPRTESAKLRAASATLQVTFKDGFFYLNNKKCLKRSLVVTPQQGYISYDDTEYHGTFVLIAHDRGCWLINSCDLEEYVFSVLRTEGWPGWPLEMNKVLAIAVRTYVIAMVKEAKECKRPYHVKNSNVHQTYSGVHNSLELRRAVEATAGLFLSYNEKPIIAMFDVCCGGIIPAGIRGVDFKKAPYLARDYACKYCKDCSSYSWSVSFDKQYVLEKLRKEHPHLRSLRDIKVTKKDKAGLVLEVMAKGSHTKTFTGKKMYSLFKEVKSFCFNVVKKGDTITFKGYGMGHHLGLCQWGARSMVRDGWDHKSILAYYYPDTLLMRIV